MVKSFNMRKQFFNNEESGFFKTQKREGVVQNPMAGKLISTDAFFLIFVRVSYLNSISNFSNLNSDMFAYLCF